MSKVIEEQVVKMQFDNKGFEEGVQQSMSTLDKLKAALHFKDVNLTPLEQAFANAEATASQAGFHLRDVWLKVSTEFEERIATKIVDSAEKITKALTIQGAMDGFNEYELKMGSIQTIMAGTGESLATVNKYLDELNTYSDKTIYSFKDMTSNIGKFTNAGVKLDDAVLAIKGIANEAAVSGANANEASRAMYNFSQALSAGYVKLIDWKSIENANMATLEFKNTLLEVAEGLGTVKKNADGTYDSITTNANGDIAMAFNASKSFNDSLQSQWMSTEVLTKALKIYATDIRELTDGERELYEQELQNLGLTPDQIAAFEELGIKAANSATEIKTFTMLIDTLKEAIGSGWAETWQIFIGDFEEAKELWTNVGNVLGGVIDDFSDARNEAFKIGFQNNWDKFMQNNSIPAADTFREKLTQAAIAQGKLTEEEAKDLDTKSKWLKFLREKGWMTGEFFGQQLEEYYKYLSGLDEAALQSLSVSKADILNFSYALADLKAADKGIGSTFNAITKGFSELGGRENLIQGLVNIFNAFKDILGEVGEAWGHVFGSNSADTAGQKITNLTKRFREFTERLKPSEEALKSIYTVFTLVFTGIKTAAGVIGSILNGATKLVFPLINLFDALLGVIGEFIAAITGSDSVVGFADKLNSGGNKLKNGYLKVMQKIADTINKIANAIRNWKDSTMFKTIQDWANKAQTAMSELWEDFKELPIVQEMMADFAVVSDTVSTAFDKMKIKVGEFFDKVGASFTLDNLNKVLTTIYHGLKNFKDAVVAAKDNIVKFFNEVKSGKSIGEAFKDSFSGVIDFFKNLKDTLVEFFETVFKTGDASYFDDLATAIHNFFTSLDADKVTAIVLTTVFGLFAINLLRLTNAVSDTVKSIGGTFTTLKNVINSYMKKQKSVLLQIAEAIVIVAGALYVLSTIPADEMDTALKALYSIAGCIAVLTIIMGVMSKIANSGIDDKKKLTAFGEMAFMLIGIAGTLVLAAFAIRELSNIELGDDIVKKLGVMLGAVAVMGAIAVIMSKFNTAKDGVVKSAVTLVAVAGSCYMLALSLEKISEIAKSPEALDGATEAMLKMMAAMALVTLTASRIGGFSALGLLAVVVIFEKIMPRIEDIINYDYSAIKTGLEKNKEVLEQLAKLIGGLIIIGGIFGKGFDKVGSGLIKVVGALGILVLIASAARKLTSTDIAKALSFIEPLTELLLKLLICLGICNMLSKEGGGKLGLSTFIGLGLILGVMALLGKSAKDMSEDDIKKELKFVGGLTLLVDAMLVVAGLASKGEASFKSLALVLAGVAFILGLMVTLSLIKDKSGLITAMAAIAVVILSLGTLFAAMSKLTYEASKNKDGYSKKGIANGPVFGALLSVAAVMAGMIMLSKVPIKNIIAAGTAITLAMLGLVAVFKTMSHTYATAKSTNNKRITTIMSAVIGVAAVTEAIYLLSKYGKDAKSMVAASAAITIGMLGLAACIKVLGHISGTTKKEMSYKGMLESIGAAVGAMIIVGAAIAALSHLGGNPANMLAAAGSLTIGMLGVSIAVGAMALAGKLCKDADSFMMGEIIIGAIVALGAVATAIGVLSNYGGDPDTMIKSSLALAIGCIAVGAAAVLLGVAGKLCKDANPVTMGEAIIGTIVGLAAVFGAIVGLGKLLTPEEAQSVATIGPSFALIMGAFGVMCLALSEAAKIARGVSFVTMLEVIGGGLVAMAALLASAWALGELFETFEGAEESINHGLDFLVGVFTKIGEAIGGFIGGGLGKVIGQFVDEIGESLNVFMDDKHMGGFLKKVEQVPEDAVKGAKNIAEALGAFISVGLKQALVDWLPGVDFGEIDAYGLGKMVADFSAAVGALSPQSLNQAKLAAGIATSLAEFASKLGYSGGILEIFKGKQQSIEEFGTGLVAFTIGLKAFADEAKKLTDSDIDAIHLAISAADIVREFSTTLVSYGGIKSWIFGDKQTIGEFGESLTEFANGMYNLVLKLKAVEGINTEYSTAIQKCADAVVPLNTLSEELDTTGGLLAKVVGHSDLKSFSETFVPFAENLYKFVSYVSDNLDWEFADLITHVTESVEPLADLADAISSNETSILGLIKIKSENGNLEEFGDSLKGFAKGVAKACKELSDEDVDIDALSDIIPFIEDLKSITGTASGISPTTFSNITKSVNELAEINIKKLKEAFELDTSVSEALADMLSGLMRTISSRSATDNVSYNRYGKDMATAIKTGIDESESIFGPSIDNLLKAIKDKLSLTFNVDTFKTYGEYLSEGLALGIEAKSDRAISAANALATATAQATAKGLDERSPSRLSNKYGRFWDEGLANGIKDNIGTVVRSTSGLSDSVISTTSNIVSQISRAMNTDMDFQPTIRPVLDTSDISAKSKEIDGMFGDVSRSFNASDLNLVRRVSGTFNGNVAAKSAIIEETNGANNTKELADAVFKAASEANSNTQVNVVLEGDAAGVFRLVRQENKRFIKSTGYAPLA